MTSGMSVWRNKCAVGPAMDIDLLLDILPHSFSHEALNSHQWDFMAPHSCPSGFPLFRYGQ